MKKLIIMLMFASVSGMAQIQYVNEEVIEIAKSQIGKKVGKRGICFDFVDYVLTKTDINWKKRGKTKYIYGKKIRKSKVRAGDIFTFDNVRLSYARGKYNHVGIILQNKGNGHYDTIEQNVGGSNVIYNDIDLSQVISGKVTFYRPYKKL